MPKIAEDRLCIRCEKREIMGKPYSVYVCVGCYREIKQAVAACACICHECGS